MSTTLPDLPPGTTRTIAALYCSGSIALGAHCGWYHANWNLLRRLQLVSNPFWHETFYAKSLSSVMNGGNEQVKLLICGAADEGMLQCVLNHIPSNVAHITMIDSCRTPLVVAELAARKRGAVFTALQANALRMPFPDQFFHAIVTDAFLTRFSADERLSIVREWHRLLRPGGRIITTARILAGASGGYSSTRGNIMRFGARAAGRAALCAINPVTSFTVALKYARRMKSIPFGSVRDIESLFCSYSRVHVTLADEPFQEVEPKSYARVEAFE